MSGNIIGKERTNFIRELMLIQKIPGLLRNMPGDDTHAGLRLHQFFQFFASHSAASHEEHGLVLEINEDGQ
jgi:hypothetical protein